MTNEEKQKILEYRMKQRRKHKRCKYCKYREKVDWVFYCPWKEKFLSTEWNFGYQGCFCKFYKPKELTINEI